MTPWQEYKKKLGTTRPWDILKPNVELSGDEIELHRFSICEACPSLIKATKQCKECGCFMKLKVKILSAQCPIGKW